MDSDLWQLLVSLGVQGILWKAAIWGAVGAVLGLVIGLLAFYGLGTAGAYRWGWKHAQWFRAAVCVSMVAVCLVSFAVIGTAQGFYRGCHHFLYKGKIATSVLPAVGDAAASCIAFLYLKTESPSETQATEESDWKRVQAFRNNEWELDVPQLLQGVGSLSESITAQAISIIQNDVFERWPSWKGGKLESFLDTQLRGIVRGIVTIEVRKKIDEDVKKHLGFKLIQGLEAEAAKRGDPRTLGYAELTEFLVEQAIIPALLLPVRQFVRSLQFQLFLAVLAVLFLPPPCFLLAESIRQRRASKQASVNSEQ